MEFTSEESALWYGTPDAPAPDVSVHPDTRPEITVWVRPAHSSNALDALYRIDGGPERRVRGALLRSDPARDAQFFRAVFPWTPPGSIVEYGPRLSNGGRTLTSVRGGSYPSSFGVLRSGASGKTEFSSDAAPAPIPFRLEPIGRLQVELARHPEVIGQTPDGLRLDFFIRSGTLQGRVNGVVRPEGGDWLRVRTDGIGLVDIRLTVQAEDGVLLLMEAAGSADLGVNGYARAAAGQLPPVAPISATPRFLCADARYAWLVRLQCLAVGRIWSASMVVEYDVYGLNVSAGGDSHGR